jgi:hypothetical protein
MRRLALLVFIVLLGALLGCGGKKVVNMEKSLVYSGGTHLISNVASIRPDITSGGTGLLGMSDDEIKTWLSENPDANVERAIYFDDFKLDLGTQMVSSPGEFNRLRKDLEGKMDQINKFLKGDKKQLKVEDW